MTEVIVAHEKHGTFTYASAFKLLKDRLAEGWYYNYDEGDAATQYEDRARQIVAGSGDAESLEKVAWAFLRERRDHEYEYVERQTVQA